MKNSKISSFKATGHGTCSVEMNLHFDQGRTIICLFGGGVYHFWDLQQFFLK